MVMTSVLKVAYPHGLVAAIQRMEVACAGLEAGEVFWHVVEAIHRVAVSSRARPRVMMLESGEYAASSVVVRSLAEAIAMLRAVVVQVAVVVREVGVMGPPARSCGHQVDP